MQAIYVPVPPSLDFSYTSGLKRNGAIGARYRVEYASNLNQPITWTPFRTQTLANTSITFSNARPAGSNRRFYRAILQP